MNKNYHSEEHILFTGERLLQNEVLLKPHRIENLARFKFFTNFIDKGRVLDFGCGTGEGTDYLSKNPDYDVFGLDISYFAIRFAKKLYSDSKLRFICGDVLNPGIVDQKFDGVVSIEVIEHIYDAEKYLLEITRILKLDGMLMLTTPNKLLSSPTEGSLWPDHVKEYTYDELKSLCEKYFKQVTFFGEYIPVYEKNKLRQLLRKLSPCIKPHLPKWVRVRALPMLFSLIKSDISIEDIVFTDIEIEKYSTLVAVCREPIK
jgi:2-polyprenyl-3-methyl-5-hydroxy-6-metoxy-1,4-benzoquinol methylase